MRRVIRLLQTALAITLFSVSVIAAPITVADVAYPQTLKVENQQVQLNGAGIRYKAVFKVYTAGLYLAKPAKTAREAYAQPGAKRINLTMLREVESTSLGRLFIRGIEDNVTRSEYTKLLVEIEAMSQIFSAHKSVGTGESINIDWVPGTGTVISVNGVRQGEPFKNPALYEAMMAIWLGERPADWQLKDALLGTKR